VVKALPTMKPRRRYASLLYSEQDGTKRHAAGKSGETSHLYVRRGICATWARSRSSALMPAMARPVSPLVRLAVVARDHSGEVFSNRL
jgi:hypothetical protein